MLVGILIVGAVGILMWILAYRIARKQEITLFHSYHVDKVTEEKKKAFCTLAGRGLFVMGSGLIATAILLAFTDSPWSFLLFAAGFAAGMGMLIAAERKYNR